MRSVDGSILGLFVFWEFEGSLYVMVSAVKLIRTCVSGNGPVCGE